MRPIRTCAMSRRFGIPAIMGVVAMMLITTSIAQAQTQTAERGLGRLFFTPEQRARLDASRREALANLNRPAAPLAPAAPKAAPPKVVTLQGVVKRSDGETTVWVNGKAVNARFGDSDIGAGSIARDSVGIDLPGTKRRVRLKVGQSMEATSGTIEEGYRRRRTLPSAAVPMDDVPAEDADGGTTSPTTPAPARRRADRDQEMPDARFDGDS